LKFSEIHWIVKDNYIGSAFFDATASAFILPILLENREAPPTDRSLPQSSPSTMNNTPFTTKGENNNSSSSHNQDLIGYGLGPQWMQKTHFRERIQQSQEQQQQLDGNNYSLYVSCCCSSFSSFFSLCSLTLILILYVFHGC
jgi:hypothetical protein